MNVTDILAHYDSGQRWPHAISDAAPYNVETAYQDALALRALRLARGEHAKGYKIGFTNRSIWPIYQVFAPIWGTVWDTTLQHTVDTATVSLAHICQPRLEPEIVFGLARAPAPDADLDALFDCLDWMAPGFEVVQSHLPDWKFQASDTIADGGLHARLVVGTPQPITALAASAQALQAQLAAATASLCRGGAEVARGCGADVLDNPLQALFHFVKELQRCPGAPTLQAGDVVTTGTWTDAFPVQAGEDWSVQFSWAQMRLGVQFTA